MTSNAYMNNCPHKLPCGLCKLTMMNCPKGWWSYTATNSGGINTVSSSSDANTVSSEYATKGSNDATVDCGWK